VLLFAPKKEHEVQSFMLKLVNNNCPELRNLAEGPRLENRVNLTLVALVIPVAKKRPAVERLFAAVTKEFTTTGVALVLHEPRAVEEVILGFHFEGAMKFIRAQAKHLNPMGAGFYQLGLKLTEMIHTSDCPALASVSF
jgi:hypothetical protein